MKNVIFFCSLNVLSTPKCTPQCASFIYNGSALVLSCCSCGTALMWNNNVYVSLSVNALNDVHLWLGLVSDLLLPKAKGC